MRDIRLFVEAIEYKSYKQQHRGDNLTPSGA